MQVVWREESSMNTLAIDIGGTKWTIALFVDGQIVRRETHATDRDGGRPWMLDQLLSRIRAWQADSKFEQCGIGFGGPVDFATQRVVQSTHVDGWTDFALPAFLKQHLALPTIVDNDANAAALGEATYGAGQGQDPLLYVTLSTGIGSGMVVGGQVLRGANSYAGELGHLCIQPDGPVCLCGAQGCLERICSGLWLERDYGQPVQILMQDAAFVQRYVVDLARGLKAAIMLLNPARVVIGGGIAKAGDRLFDPLRTELHRQIPAWSRAQIDIVPAALGDDSVLYGASALTSNLPKT